MKTTVPERRDRAGHEWLAGAVALALLLFCPTALSAQGPGNYAASRFDVAATVVEGVHLDVKEAITFEFQTGTFRRVWREIPAGGTDGIEILEARLDGRVAPRGDGPGQVKISGRNRIKVEWQFESRADQWARYLKAHPGSAPGWFQAAAQDDGAAFAAFVGSHAATSGSSGGGGGGGAAGGGGSGAG